MKSILKTPLAKKITANLTTDDEALIAAAEYPEEAPAAPELVAKKRGEFRGNRIVLLEGFGIFTVLLIIGIVMKNFALCFAFGSTLVLVLLAIIALHLRPLPDETATMITIPVHHIESGTFGEAAICYLPDGKYRVLCNKKVPNPVSVTVFRYGRHTNIQLNGKDWSK